jgi:hypothetical protein
VAARSASNGLLAAVALQCFAPVVSDRSDVSTRSDQDLLERAAALQLEAREVLTEVELERTLIDFGPALFAGSFVSGLMTWRDLDIMFLGGPTLSPPQLLNGLEKLVGVPGVVGLQYVDERGDRSPTGETRDERYHVVATYVRPSARWRLDLTVWLHDHHENVAAWHQTLSRTLSDDHRICILRIKDVWCRRPEYPDEVSGFEITTAVLEHDVRTPEQFAAWLAADKAS